MMAFEIGDRFESMQQVCEALSRYLDDEASDNRILRAVQPASQARFKVRVWRQPTRRLALISTAAILIALAAVVLLVRTRQGVVEF